MRRRLLSCVVFGLAFASFGCESNPNAPSVAPAGSAGIAPPTPPPAKKSAVLNNTKTTEPQTTESQAATVN